MDSAPVIKRRKLNPVVNKPFKSPLRTTLSQHVASTSGSPLASRPVANASEPEQTTSASDGINGGTHTTPLRRRPFAISATSTASPLSTPGDPVTAQKIQDEIRAIRSLESSLMKTRQNIDTLNQALRLATGNKDTELDALATKWRFAARQAAEEVFAGARDKVNRMGGVGAWRERQKEMASAFNEWNHPPVKDEDDEEEIYDENGDLVEVVKRKKEERFEDEWEYDAEAREEEKQDEGRDDDSYTMDMMLKMLNIDLSLIGYDKDRQRWVG